jgi:hypothetical protein
MLNILKIKPLANYIVTTRDEYTGDETSANSSLVVKQKGALKEYQKVVAVGPLARGVQVGDLVAINPRRYAVKKYQEGSLKDGIIKENPVIHYNFNVIELDHVPHLLITDQDIDFVIEKWEDEKEPESTIIVPEKKIIV